MEPFIRVNGAKVVLKVKAYCTVYPTRSLKADSRDGKSKTESSRSSLPMESSMRETLRTTCVK